MQSADYIALMHSAGRSPAVANEVVASYALPGNPYQVRTMSQTLEALENEVLRLPANDRVRLLDRVVASLDADSARDAAWDALAARRDAELAAGITTEAPLDDVLTKLRAELR